MAERRRTRTGDPAGVRSLRKWWEAAVEGLSMKSAAGKYPEVK